MKILGLLFLLLTFSWVGSAQILEQPLEQPLEFESCLLTGSSGLATRKAECAELWVAEDPSLEQAPDTDPQIRRIPLRIARIKATSRSPEPDPVFFFAGGPGQSAVDSFYPVLAALRHVRRNRDLILVDQRGTGEGSRLVCDLPEDISWLDRPSPERIRALTLDCLGQMDAAPQFYTTEISVGDMERVREAMGYEQINLFGVSYGTRMAQTYARRFPERVRTVLLDSVMSTQQVMGLEQGIRLERSLYQLFDRCERDIACAEIYPNLRTDFELLKQQVRQSPQEIEIINPTTGVAEGLLFDLDVLAVSLRILTYSSESRAILPLLIQEAAGTGDYQRLASFAVMISESLGDAINSVLDLSVVCSEDFPSFPDNLDALQPLLPDEVEKLSDSLMAYSLYENYRNQCSIWPTGTVAEDFHEPFNGEMPALLLSGQYDPVTPPEYGEVALTQFARGRHLILKGQGHSVAGLGCMPKLLGRFIDEASSENLDVECLEVLDGAPVFRSLLGPAP